MSNRIELGTGIYGEIVAERAYQEAKWGEQNHSPIEWCAILGEEVGEVQKAALEAHFSNKEWPLEEYREELIQVAAVAVAMVESLGRNNPDESWSSRPRETELESKIKELEEENADLKRKANDFEKAANDWMNDYDRLKEKYESTEPFYGQN